MKTIEQQIAELKELYQTSDMNYHEYMDELGRLQELLKNN